MHGLWGYSPQPGSFFRTYGKSEQLQFISCVYNSQIRKEPIQLLTNHLSFLISKMWSLYTLGQSLTRIELFFNFTLLVLTIIKGFDKGCGYSFYYTIIMIILLGCLSTEFNGMKKKQFGVLVFSCVFRVTRLALAIAGLIMTYHNINQEIDLHFVVVPL